MKRFFRCLSLALSALCLAIPAGAAAEGASVPELTVYRRELPASEALEFTKQLKIGWNLGNTLDAYADPFKGNDLVLEKSWVGTYTTREMFTALHGAGFNTVRIPVSWHNHVDADFVINEKWLSRVQEVVDYALGEGMYVILNTHHDNFESFYYPSGDHMDVSEKYISAIWTQVAARFADYDEHLIFESMNEPRQVGTDHEWNYDVSNPACREAADCINRLNQIFVDTVRASGGKNAERYLMVPGYDASPAGALSDEFALPKDSAENRLIVSVHAYTPYPFALDAAGTNEFSLTLNGPQVREIVTFMNRLYDRYIKQGIPVVIGEFGARNKQNNLQARVDFAAQYIALASARGIPCLWWDNAATRGSGECFGLLDRTSCEFHFPEIVDALMRYAGYDSLPEFQG